MSDTYRTFESFKAGESWISAPKTLTKQEIIAFAEAYDPQPFHLDEDAAAQSLLGGLAASGWHSCATLMRLLCDDFLLNSSSMGSPGIDEVKWLQPVFPGDALRMKASVLETRASNSRPDMGLVRFHFDLLKANQDVAMTMQCSIMFARTREEA